MSHQILDYFRKHRQLIEENLVLSEDPSNTEAIHNLRLSIKRLRVVAWLTSIISEPTFNSGEKLLEVNKLFKRSGRLRDIQVIKQLMIGFDRTELHPVIESFIHRESKQRLKFEQVLKIFDQSCLDDFEKGLTDSLQGKSTHQIMYAGLSLLTNMEIELHELYHGSADEERLHHIRTRLKSINYLNNIFEDRLPIQDQLNISIERLQETGEIAGTWHDCLNLEGKLERYINKNPDAADSLQPFITDLKTRKQGLFQEYICILLNELKI